ncbi:MAG: flagellar hook assembly protein FlgD [Aquabacterium sp.]|jgi:flagellar basal-body rod modification protein FlgD|nr:MAG: flagellar hook assembly protein FlgD [Aquabacterium sp.]
MSSVIDTINSNNAAKSTLGSGTSANDTTTAAATSDRFLKLLVAQMKNQDPLNPMDNAQVTTQMAQINTVSGIEKLNSTITDMSSVVTQSQMMQGASLVGHNVVVAGNDLTVSEGKATAGYELASAADKVKVEVLTAGGTVVDTLTYTKQDAGLHAFTWEPGTGMPTTGVSFRVSATTGDKVVTSTAINVDSVSAVSNSGGSLQLELGSGKTAKLSDIKAIS